jgi:hypothetical protein
MPQNWEKGKPLPAYGWAAKLCIRQSFAYQHVQRTEEGAPHAYQHMQRAEEGAPHAVPQ